MKYYTDSNYCFFVEKIIECANSRDSLEYKFISVLYNTQ